MKNLLFLILLLLLCQREPSAAQQNASLPVPFEKGAVLMAGADWISGTGTLPETDSLFYADDPAPLLRTSFKSEKKINKAELWITAAGYYETWINGKRVGDRQIDPAWTDFSKRIYASGTDVTTLVQKGENVWGIMLGNGFYNPLPLRMWGGRNLRNDMKVGKPCAKAVLRITFGDGTSKTIVTSGRWQSKPGPVIRNSVYLGEYYDAGKETAGWNSSSAAGDGWSPVEVVAGPGGAVEPAFFPPVSISAWVDPISVMPAGDSRQLVDFGQNMTGTIRLRIDASKGDTIRIRYGELLYPDGKLNPMTAVCGQIKRKGVGGPGAPAIAEQLDMYVAKGAGEEWFQPRFTFHGFRYAEVSGLRKPLQKQDIQAGRMHTAVQEACSVTSSSEYLNKLNDACRWTFLSNLQSVQSDCPAREKFGYGGDINATADAYIYNYDMQSIYRKMIFDWADAMKPTGFVDTAPFVGIEYCGISWESAFLFLQDALWIHYADSALIREMYATDCAWMDKVSRLHPKLVVDNGLSDHESLAKVPVELTGTCHYFQAARTMARFAAINNDEPGVKKYSLLAESIRERIIDLFWDTPQIEVPNRQTLLASLIWSEVLRGSDRAKAVDLLLAEMQKSDYHVTTGIFGTKYLLDALSSTGHADVAFRVVNQSGFPGWRHMIESGATTIWETWKESDNTFSQNHPMFGSVSEWYLKWLGGIRPDENNPAVNRIILNPQPVAGLDSMSVQRTFPSGLVSSQWRRQDTSVLYEFTIPVGMDVRWIPPAGTRDIKVRVSPEDWDPVRSRDQSVFTLRDGHYVFETAR
jgi:alpha-L-rhamnosidase